MASIWIVQAGEANEGLEIVYAGAQGMVFADSSYGKAVEAFRKVVKDRLANLEVLYSWGEFDTDARADITAKGIQRDCWDDDCGCAYTADVVKLAKFEVIGA